MDPRQVCSDRIIEILEFDRVRNRLANLTSFLPGRERAAALAPIGDFDGIKARLQETEAARELLLTRGAPPLDGLRDLRPVLGRAGRGGILTPGELLAVLSTLRGAGRLRQYIMASPDGKGKDAVPAEGWPGILWQLARQLPELGELEQAITGAVTESEGIADGASQELSRIRREQCTLKARIRDRLEAAVRSPANQNVLQEPIVTTRRGRYVVPIKQEYRSQFPGVVHDYSASGATAFIEPLEVVAANNRLRQLEKAEEVEVERILRLLSAQVAAAGPQLDGAVETLARLDLALAKGRLSLDMDAVDPRLNREGRFKLHQGRHPLLGGRVVPVDVDLARELRTLIITGPNTGGKTVTLKTVGLLALMAQAGLFIPAGADSTMPIFAMVFADIGDEQSIEQNLSTFSGHMVNIINIIGEAGPESLVLLDEIGAGTDPAEGAALAASLLEHFHALGSRTVATTHYSQLKTFAYLHPGAANASMEFDPETLEPTFQLRLGLPGRSNALEIAGRLGLPAGLAARARQLLEGQHADMEAVIQGMEAEYRAAGDLRLQAQRERAQAEELRERYRQRWEQLREKETTILSSAREEATTLLKQARKEAAGIIGELRALEKSAREKAAQSELVKEGERNRARLAGLVKEVEAKARGGQLVPPPDAAVATGWEASPGERVCITSLRRDGTLLETRDGTAVVETGILKVEVPLEDLGPALEAGRGTGRATAGAIARRKSETVAPEVHLRGMTVEEALSTLDKYLDDVFLAGLAQARVIHGKGTGTLRDAVRRFLDGHPHVASYRRAGPAEGGEGVTVVDLAN